MVYSFGLSTIDYRLKDGFFKRTPYGIISQ